ncbi:MAG: hypothetical protein ACI8ZB_003150 [Desulforhopalus sp.]|jgi:hypothetical protein
MKILISQLNFNLPEKPFGSFPKRLDLVTEKVRALAGKAGTGNETYNKAYSAVAASIRKNQDLLSVIDKPIKIRALANLIGSEFQDRIDLSGDLLEKINHLKPKPSSLFIENVYQHYLTKYDKLSDHPVVADWLKSAMAAKGLLTENQKQILGSHGPHWLAGQCIKNKREFSNQIRHLNLQNYKAGRFLTIAKQIYFVKQLEGIPVNKPHEILEELQHSSVVEARYDETYLLGHKVLQILIARAPEHGIHDSWLNVIMGIAGDPRVPTTHSNYRKWWSALEPRFNRKVRGWVSRLDLRLFLEAIRDYSDQSGDYELKRMFPARKFFLEGLLNKQLITNTRLYLSSGAVSYLRRNYKKEHLPIFSRVDGNRSIIHVELGGVHLIEGSHSCYLWIYPKMHESAIVFDYSETYVTYRSLTQGLSDAMYGKGTPSIANITHNPTNFSWQHRAIGELKSIGVNITARDVLPPEDYHDYLRRHGRD